MTEIITDALKLEGLKNWGRIQHESMLRYAEKRKQDILNHKKHKRPKKRYQGLKFAIPKEKSYSQLVKVLDSMVSAYILQKGKYTCVRCHKQYFPNKNGKYIGLTCSHYWDRQYKGTRFEVDNLDPLCWRPCHSQKWEHDKQGAYKDYMIKKLGKKKFDMLEIKARAITKFSSSDIQFMINNFSQFYK